MGFCLGIVRKMNCSTGNPVAGGKVSWLQDISFGFGRDPRRCLSTWGT